MFYNVKGEEIVYISRLAGTGILNVFLAGTTKPNPEYRSSHNITVKDEFDKYQFEYVFRGTGYIETGEAKYTVRAGDFFFLNKLKPHYYYSDPSDLLEKIFITVNGALVDHLTAAYGLTDSVVIRRVNAYPMLSDILGILAGTDASNRDASFDRTAVKLFELIQLVSPQKYGLPPESRRDTGELILNYIENNLERRLTLEDIAAYFFLSKSQIMRVFKEKYGVSPMSYAKRRRIEIARSLLSYTRLRVEEISDMLSFSSSKHFAKAFGEANGVSPSEWRRKLNKN